MKVLADTSIWIAYFRDGVYQKDLDLLQRPHQLFVHPHVTGELALGSLRNRQQTLDNLDSMPQAEVISLHDLRSMIEARRCFARGIGLTDAHLLGSCLVSPGQQLWTLDRRLLNLASELKIPLYLPATSLH